MKLPFSLNPALERLPVYQPGRPVEEVARELGLPVRGVIKLASNENPLGPSPKALAAMRKALPNLHMYPDGSAFYLKQKLAAKLGVTPAHLVLGNGSNDIIEFLGHALLGHGDEMVVSQYCFAIYPIVAKLLGAQVVTVPAKNYGHDLPAMLKAVTARTKLMFVANPNNPTGTIAPAEDVRKLVNELPGNVVLAMDEAYIEFLDKPVDLLAEIKSGRKPNIILLRTFSKIYGLAGLRLGYGIAHPEFIAALEKIRQPFNVNSLAQAAAMAAMDDTTHVRKTQQNNIKGRKFLEKELSAMGIEVVPTAANFILAKVGAGREVFEQLQRAGIITRPMGGYQLPEFIRISIGAPAENQRCVKALKKILPRNKHLKKL